jgi:putative ABC transport system permease protein
VLASVRWVAADLRARRAQALLSVLLVAGVVMALLLAATFLEDTTNPWQRLFAGSRGAHVWLHARPGADLRPLARLDGVTALAGPYGTAATTLVRTAREARERAPLELRAAPAAPPAVARPLVREGRWLDGAAVSAVVLERSFAHDVHARVGDRVTVSALDGSAHTLLVAGIADTTDQGFYPDWTPGLAWVSPETLARVEPDRSHTQQVVGLRLADPGAADFVVQRAITRLGDANVERVTTWRAVRAGMELNNRLLGQLLAVFGLVALLAAALAIGNAIGGRVLAQAQDMAILKAVGFTPGQIMRMLLLEHTTIGLAGVMAGAAGAWALAALVPGVLGASAAVAPPAPNRVAAIGAGAELTVALATVVPAWQAARVSFVKAVKAAPPSGRLSRLARLALLLRLPPALVLGARGAFARPLRAVLTIGGVAIPMLMITIGLGTWSTLDRLERHPERVGLSALTVHPRGVRDEVALRTVSAHPDVVAAYPGTDVEALLPGQNRTVRVRALGTSSRPYPFAVPQGRVFGAPGEAVAGQGLLDALRASVGQRVRLTVGGAPLIVHIVGRNVETEDNGEVLSLGLDTLEQLGQAPPAGFYGVTLRRGADPATVRADLLRASGDRYDVRVVPNPAEQLSVVRVMIIGLVVVLGLIGLAALLTAIAVGLRDHARDLGALRAMGLTPRQVATTIVTSTSLVTLVAVVAGIALGLATSTRIIDLQARASGVGVGLGAPPSARTLLAVGTSAVAAAAAAALVPASRAARVTVTRALQPS